MTSLTSLSQPELDVMLQLAQSRTTSVVRLAADLWRTTPDWLATDPYPLLTYTLEALSERGLCTFRIQKGVPLGAATVGGHRRTTGDMAFDIRLTPKGWELMGYATKTVEVGSAGRHERQSIHPGDMTDYVNLAGHTYGGPIEVEDFPTHRDRYPRHVHMYGVELTMANTATRPKRTRNEALADPRNLADPNGVGERGYIRVTPEMEARVLGARQAMGDTASMADIGRYLDLPERTIRYVLTDLPRLRRTSNGEDKAQRSLKDRVYEAVRALGVINDVPELRRIVGMADTDHDLMHVLHSLHTQGRIDFDERGSGMGKATVVNIRLPKKGGKRLTPEVVATLPEIVADRLPESIQPEATTEGTPQSPPPSAPGPEDEGYPLLELLLQRERARQEQDNKGMAFIVAAEAIQDIDPGTARELMEKAKQYDVPFPSPLEAEYIRYVATHGEVKS